MRGHVLVEHGPEQIEADERAERDERRHGSSAGAIGLDEQDRERHEHREDDPCERHVEVRGEITRGLVGVPFSPEPDEALDDLVDAERERQDAERDLALASRPW